MRKILYPIFALAALFTYAGCADWITPDPIYKEPENIYDNEGSTVYQDLLAYKKDMAGRQVMFGWFDEWTGTGSYRNMLRALPDSIDIVSHWNPKESYVEPLTDFQKHDLAEVHKRGTKVLFCLFFKDLGFRLTPGLAAAQANVPSEEYIATMREKWGWYERNYDASPEADAAIAKYADEMSAYVIENGYDGIDFDFERNYGERGNLVESNAALHVLLTALSRNFGPKSGTGRLLVVDGEPQTLSPESGPLLDYYIIQAYSNNNASGDSYLDARFATGGIAGAALFATFGEADGGEANVLRKTIWTEDFESGQNKLTGGPEYRFRNGHVNPGLNADGTPKTSTYSLDGMCRYYREIDGEIVKAGGAGAYRFNLSRLYNDYTLYRRAIQTMNPAEN
ncbi:MAG: endo-beta-N-acetylglucosaminidase [Bacteroidales bacterium]|nr:endo-beta-N-acetylglucosaminidase [Bacteroidales bacterium]